jgi:hypothetical protein
MLTSREIITLRLPKIKQGKKTVRGALQGMTQMRRKPVETGNASLQSV